LEYTTVGVGSTIHSDEYQKLLAMIREARTRSGVTQIGERRIDIEELRQLCIALGVDFLKLVRQWLAAVG